VTFPVLYPTSILRIWMCLPLPPAEKLIFSVVKNQLPCFLFLVDPPPPQLPFKKPPQFKSLKLKFVLYALTHTHTHVYTCVCVCVCVLLAQAVIEGESMH